MKIKKVASLCTKNKTFCLYDKREGGHVSQWLGDGFAAYPINGLPYLEEDNIYALFDVAEKQRIKYQFKHEAAPEGICFDDEDPGEHRLDNEYLSVMYAGTVLQPLQTKNGIVFIQNKYLSPIDDLLDVLALYERTTPAGKTYIAAKAGFLLTAIIFPFEVIGEKFVSSLERLTLECKHALAEKRRAEESERAMQVSMFTVIDEETGEILDPEEQEE